jgi:hypothetical protein
MGQMLNPLRFLKREGFEEIPIAKYIVAIKTERRGFEPPDTLLHHLISSQTQSTTLPPLQTKHVPQKGRSVSILP